MLEETDAMTAPSGVDPARFLDEQLTQASPDPAGRRYLGIDVLTRHPQAPEGERVAGP